MNHLMGAFPVTLGAEELEVEGSSGFVPNYILGRVVAKRFAKTEKAIVIHPEKGFHHCVWERVRQKRSHLVKDFCGERGLLVRRSGVEVLSLCDPFLQAR